MLNFRRNHRGRLGVSAGAVMALAGALLVPTTSAHADDLWTRDTLTGDWGGFRTQMSNAGIDWSLTYVGEVFGNTSGGLIRGSSYEDLIALEVDSDLEKLVGWKGGTAHVSLYQIDNGGRNIADLVGAISDPSNIDALSTFRIFTLYVEQALGDKGSLRVGQLAADDEFVISDTAAYLINGTFGWANFAAANLPGGGPGYPLATPGVRLQWDATEKVTALGAIFNGNPAGDSCGPDEDPQRCDYHGTNFSLDAGTFYIGEVQYRPTKSASNSDDGPPESVYRFGGWYHDDGFENLGNPDGKDLDGNWLFYGIMDQTVWHNDTSALTFFARIAGAPEDRNPIAFYVDTGFGITAPIASRPDDVLVFGYAYSDISSDISGLNRRDRRAGMDTPIASGESAFELLYVAQITPWWSIQPDMQYIIRPGAGLEAKPGNPNEALDDSFIVGVRTEVSF
ncbi:MAG: carbohydrate porin [Pseudomonadota bacterium]